VADPDHDRPKQAQDQNPRSFQGQEFEANMVFFCSNNPQLSDFWIQILSERFAGFSGHEKRANGARNGLILPLGE
jgi:hypothetical protein